MRNAVIAAFGVFLVLLHVLMPLYGNAGLWIAVAAFLGGRALLLRLLFPTLMRTFQPS
jgi:Na+-driven multidrug efflux pump